MCVPDDSVTDLLEHRGNVGIAGRLACDKPGLEAHGGTIEVDALHEDAMDMEVHIDRTAKTLEKRDRAWVDGGPLETACDRLVDVILPVGGAQFGGALAGGAVGPPHPVAKGDGHGDPPRGGRSPGNPLPDEMRGGWGLAPPGTGGTHPPPLATEGHQQLVLARVTAEP